MTPDPSGKCLLHVFLLTYSREKSFRRTLEAIAASPLKDHLLTVMDNCSTDGTPQVCEEFRPILPRMEVRRHARNIGFGANFLRSLELSQGEYTWVLCDDDTLFPDRVAALLDLLHTARPEACFVGGPRQDEWPAGLNILPSDIQRRFRTFLTGQSFVPALVFKSSLIGSRELVEGYFSIRTNFPQLILGKKLLAGDIPYAVLKPPVLQRDDPAEKGTNPLDIIDGWSAFCRSLRPLCEGRGSTPSSRGPA
jgi:glycosyltransferase involved in cell wall biosynthesis